jgi:hypothetical protein
MGRYLRKWIGSLKEFPQDPDLVLVKLLNWNAGIYGGRATAAYPEPCNIIVAAAYVGHIPSHAIGREAFIYKDKKTKLWVQAVGTKEVQNSGITQWHDLQRSFGAVAVWYFNQAQPPRRQVSYVDLSNEMKTHDPVSSIHLLHQNGKFKLGEFDFTKIYPDKFGGVEGMYVREPIKPLDNYKIARLNKEKKLPEQKCGYSKCCIAPHGVFASATDAGKVIGKTGNWVSLRCVKEIDGYKYISKQEYLRLKELNTQGQNASPE